MLSKSLFAVVTSVALSGAGLAATIVPGAASPCAFKKGFNSGNTFTSDGPSTPTDSSVNSSINGSRNSSITGLDGFSKSDAGKLGLAGVALLGLLGGGLYLKSRLAKRPGLNPEPDGTEAAVESAYKALPSFPIQVPADALSSQVEADRVEAETRR